MRTPLLPDRSRADDGSLPTPLAYLLVLALFAAPGLSHTWGALVDFLRMCGAGLPPTADGAEVWLERAATGGTWLWLVCLLITSPGLRQHRWALPASVAASGICLSGYVADAAGQFTQDGSPSKVVGLPLQLVLLVWLTLTVVTRHGVRLRDLGIRTAQHTPATAARGVPLALVTYACFIVAGQLLWTGLKMLPGPVLHGDQATAAGAPETLSLAILVSWSSVVEELIVTGAVVALLATARRPLWECLLISALMRGIPHLYVGLPALAAVALGLACAWIFYRYGHILPLIAAHLTYDLASPPFLPETWTLWIFGSLTLAGLISAVMLRRQKPQPPRPRFSSAAPTPPREHEPVTAA